MLARLFKRRFARFERRYDYDTSYMRELVDTDLRAAAKFALAQPFLSHRFRLPADAAFAARIIATRWADCGSCLKLGIAMGREAGVDQRDITAILTGNLDDAPPGMALAASYAAAVIANDPALPELADACERRWGRIGLIGLAVATVAGLFYPLLKRGLGYGNSCEPVLAQLAEHATRSREPAE